MIIKGKTSTGRGLGAYLLQNKNDRVEEWGIRGDIPRDLKDTLDDWRSDSQGTNCTKPLYHAQLNPDRTLSRDEWDKAISLFEKAMGFENQPRAIVLHEYKGREHLHLVYSRIDGHGKALSDSWNYVRHEKAAREIEQKLGLEKTQGVFIGREGERPERNPEHAAIQQGERTEKDPREVKAEVSALYQSMTEDGTTFVNTLEKKGYTLAKGISRNYVIIDNKGGIHSLSRATGIKVAELCETLNEYPLQNLPEAKAIQHERQGLTATHSFEAPECDPQNMKETLDAKRDQGDSLERDSAVTNTLDRAETIADNQLDKDVVDEKLSLTPEELKAEIARQNRQANKDALKRYEEERDQKKEQDRGGRELSRGR